MNKEFAWNVTCCTFTCNKILVKIRVSWSFHFQSQIKYVPHIGVHFETKRNNSSKLSTDVILRLLQIYLNKQSEVKNVNHIILLLVSMLVKPATFLMPHLCFKWHQTTSSPKNLSSLQGHVWSVSGQTKLHRPLLKQQLHLQGWHQLYTNQDEHIGSKDSNNYNQHQLVVCKR